MARRVRVSKENEEFVRSLAGASSDMHDEKAFESMADAIAFASLVGYLEQHKAPLGQISGKIDTIRPEYFPPYAVPLVGLLDREDVAVLSSESEDDAIEIFEEYANGGLSWLRLALAGKPVGTMRVNHLIAWMKSVTTESDTLVVPGDSLGPDDCEY